MSKRASQCHKGKELYHYTITHGGKPVRITGDHGIVELPNGEIECIPVRNGDLGKGLRYKILKHLAAAGITVFLVAIVAQMIA